MQSPTRPGRVSAARPDWHQAVADYARPNDRRAIWQVVNTFVPYIGLWILMVWTVNQGLSYWITVPLVIVAAGLLVRIFIFFHDCTHGSFFSSPRANTALGYVSGILTFTPFDSWKRSHAKHHATAGDLDRRGTGDVWTMTVEEYLVAPWRQRFAYRFIRNPLIMFGFGPAVMFLIVQRFPNWGGKKREIISVLLTDLAVLGIVVLAHYTIGLRTYLLIQVPVMILAGTVGLWLFYIQHQFEGVYWARHESWDLTRAALEGSSFYKLPKVLQWFSGNIGLHHIHHLRPRVPNYHLQACYDNVPAMQAVKPITISESLRSLRMNLWDEERQKMVSFRSLADLPRGMLAG